MATVYTPGNCAAFQSNPTKLSVFLAGTSENGEVNNPIKKEKTNASH